MVAPVRILEFPELDSTNAEAMRRAIAGEHGPLWIAAARQTAGKGRSGRSWTSEPGNLHASLLFHLAHAEATAYQLSLVAGVALAGAVRPWLAPPAAETLRLKWPNDLLVGGAKAGGILVESMAQPGCRGLSAVIGIGLNLVNHPEDAGQPATHLAAHGAIVTPRDALAALGIALAHWLEIWNEGAGFAAIRAAWLERAGPMGEPLTAKIADGPMHGRYAGLDVDGALLMTDAAGSLRRVTYGDVTLSG